MSANAVSNAKQYVVILPDSVQGRGLPPGIQQNAQEANLSTANRKVVTLSPDQLESLKSTYQGAVIFENEMLSVPTPQELGSKPVFDVRDTPIEPQLKESIFVHGADKLHAQGVKGNSSEFSPIVVTVDTGVAAHSDLETGDRGLKFWDVFDNREEDFNDVQRHGTHVSGIMFADGGEDGVTGMAPDSQFIGIKVLNDQGSGTIASVMSGIEKAAEYYDQFAAESGRTMVVNMSLGGTAGPVAQDALHAKLKEVLDARPGMVIAFAAGNSGPRANSIGTPGNFQHERAIVVAASDTKGTLGMEDDTAANFSSRGGDNVANGQDAMRNGGIMADGTRVLSTVGENQYAAFSGTSMASPHVAGAAALLYDLAGKMQADGKLAVPLTEINPFQLLRETALDNSAINADTEGAGSLRVDKAAELLIQRYGKAAEGPKEVSQTVEANLPVRDFQTTTSTMDIAEALSLENATLDLNIPHSWKGDLVVKLTSPSGKEVVVHNRTGGSQDNVSGSFDLSEALKGESSKGTWTLSVEDKARRDTGTLQSWTLNLKGTPQTGSVNPS